MIKRRPEDRFHTACGHRQTSNKAGQRRIRKLRLNQVNSVCNVMEGSRRDKKATWQKEAVEELIQRADKEAEDRGEEAEASKLEVSRSAAKQFVRDLVKVGKAGVESPQAQVLIDRCSLAEDREQRHLATIAVARFCAQFKLNNR